MTATLTLNLPLAPTVTDSVIEAMQALITSHKLDLMKQYPNDLLVHDRSIIERAAHAGVTLAWMVGHCHTHTVLLGMHPEENSMVSYLTNLGKDDKFFTVKFGHGETFSVNEVTREAFSNLHRTHIPYQRNGSPEAFVLTRSEAKIGHVKIERTGSFQSLKYNVRVTPVEGISGADKAALRTWASHALREVSGTLFSNAEMHWCDAWKIAA